MIFDERSILSTSNGGTLLPKPDSNDDLSQAEDFVDHTEDFLASNGVPHMVPPIVPPMAPLPNPVSLTPQTPSGPFQPPILPLIQ